MLSKGGSSTKSRARWTRRVAASCECRRHLRLRISSLDPRAAGGAGSCVELLVSLVLCRAVSLLYFMLSGRARTVTRLPPRAQLLRQDAHVVSWPTHMSGNVGPSALPPGWVEAQDPRYDNATYYFDTRTKEASWTRPESRERLPLPLPATPAMPSYVRLRGLPFRTTEPDVARWFFSAPGGPITIGSVHFVAGVVAGLWSGEAVRAPRL